MAKKEKLLVDEYRIDGDLDFDNFDISEIDSGLSPEAKDTKKRTPVMDVFRGTIGGIKTSATDPRFLADLTKKSLPDSYGEVFSAADEVSSTVTSLYDEAVNQLKPQVGSIAKKIDRLVPDEQKSLKKFTSKIVDFFGSGSEYKGSSKEEIQNQSISTSLAQIFEQKQEFDENAQARDSVENKIQNHTETKRFESNFGILNSINEGVQRFSQYTERVTQAYQKKSLELQFRSYFVQSELLQATNKYFEVFRNQNEAIAKNTALPEFVKINNSERFKDIARNKFFSNVQESLFGQDSWFSGLAKKLKEDGKRYIAGIGQGLQGVATGVDAAADMREMNKSLAESGMEPISNSEMAGASAGSFIANKASDFIADKAKPWLEKNKAVAEFGNKASTLAMNPDGALSDLQNSEKFREGLGKDGIKGMLYRGADNAINYARTAAPDMRIDNPSGIQGLDTAGIFNGRTQRSIVEIIPGYLSRILREMTIIRTGDDQASSVLFDHTSGKFVDKKEIGKSIKKTLSERVGNSSYAYRLNDTTQDFLGEREATDDQKKSLDKFFSEISAIPGMNYTSENLLNTRVFANLDQDTQSLVREQLAAAASDEGGQAAIEQRLTKRMTGVKKATPDIRGEIEQFIKSGYGDILEEQGLVVRDDNNKYTIDQKAYVKLLTDTGLVTSDRNAKRGIREVSGQDILKEIEQKSEGIGSLAEPKRTKAAFKKSKKPARGRYVKSDVLSKEGITPAQPRTALDAIKNTKIYKWFYKKGEGDGLERTGPMAQDVNRTMGEEAAPGGTKLDLTTMNGNNMAAIQALAEKQDKMERAVAPPTDPSQSSQISVLQEIKQDTLRIVKLLETSGVPRAAVTQEQGTQSVNKDDYKSLFSAILSNTATALGKATVDLGKSAKDVFTFTKDKLIKPGAKKASDLYDAGKEPVANAFRSLLSSAGQMASKALVMGQDVVFNKLPSAVQQVAILGGKVKDKLKEWLNGARDIYIRGRESPVLQANLIKAGYYRDQVTNKVIKTMDDLKDLKGNIIGPAGNVILSIEEAAEGLYDQHGEKIKGIFGKLASAAAGYAMAGLQRAKAFWKEAVPVGKGALGKARGLLNKAKDSISAKVDNMSTGSMGGGTGGSAGLSSDKIYDVLVEMRDLMRGESPRKHETKKDFKKFFVGPMPQKELAKKGNEAVAAAKKAKTSLTNKAVSLFGGLKAKVTGLLKPEDTKDLVSQPGLADPAPPGQVKLKETATQPAIGKLKTDSLSDKVKTVYSALTKKARPAVQTEGQSAALPQSTEAKANAALSTAPLNNEPVASSALGRQETTAAAVRGLVQKGQVKVAQTLTGIRGLLKKKEASKNTAALVAEPTTEVEQSQVETPSKPLTAEPQPKYRSNANVVESILSTASKLKQLAPGTVGKLTGAVAAAGPAVDMKSRTMGAVIPVLSPGSSEGAPAPEVDMATELRSSDKGQAVQNNAKPLVFQRTKTNQPTGPAPQSLVKKAQAAPNADKPTVFGKTKSDTFTGRLPQSLVQKGQDNTAEVLSGIQELLKKRYQAQEERVSSDKLAYDATRSAVQVGLVPPGPRVQYQPSSNAVNTIAPLAGRPPELTFAGKATGAAVTGGVEVGKADSVPVTQGLSSSEDRTYSVLAQIRDLMHGVFSSKPEAAKDFTKPIDAVGLDKEQTSPGSKVGSIVKTTATTLSGRSVDLLRSLKTRPLSKEADRQVTGSSLPAVESIVSDKAQAVPDKVKPVLSGPAKSDVSIGRLSPSAVQKGQDNTAEVLSGIQELLKKRYQTQEEQVSPDKLTYDAPQSTVQAGPVTPGPRANYQSSSSAVNAVMPVAGRLKEPSFAGKIAGAAVTGGVEVGPVRQVSNAEGVLSQLKQNPSANEAVFKPAKSDTPTNPIPRGLVQVGQDGKIVKLLSSIRDLLKNKAQVQETLVPLDDNVYSTPRVSDPGAAAISADTKTLKVKALTQTGPLFNAESVENKAKLAESAASTPVVNDVTVASTKPPAVSNKATKLFSKLKQTDPSKASSVPVAEGLSSSNDKTYSVLVQIRDLMLGVFSSDPEAAKDFSKPIDAAGLDKERTSPGSKVGSIAKTAATALSSGAVNLLSSLKTRPLSKEAGRQVTGSSLPAAESVATDKAQAVPDKVKPTVSGPAKSDASTGRLSPSAVQKGQDNMASLLASVQELLKKKNEAQPAVSPVVQTTVEESADKPTEPLAADLAPKYRSSTNIVDTIFSAGSKLKELAPVAMGKLTGAVAATRSAKGLKGKALAGIGSLLSPGASAQTPAPETNVPQTDQAAAPPKPASLSDKAKELFTQAKDKVKTITKTVSEKPQGKQAYNDKDGSGKRDGDWRDRIDQLAKRKKDNTKDPLQADLTARYKSDQNIIDTIMQKAGGIFDLAKGGLTGILGSAGDLLSGGGGLLDKLKGGIKGIAKSPIKGTLGAIKGVASAGIGALKTVGAPIAAAGKALGGVGAVGRVLSAGRMVQMAGMIGSLATGGIGSVAMAAASASMSALAGVMASPVILGALAVGAVGYGAYKAFKYFTRNSVNAFENIRMKQYGLGLDANSTDYNSYMLNLEEYLQDGCITYDNGKASLNDKKVNKDELLAIFKIEKEDNEMVQRFTKWFQSRFKPFFLTHLTALFSINNKAKLADVEKLKPEEKTKYLELTKFEGGPYSETVSPIKQISELAVNDTVVTSLHEALLVEVKNLQSKGSKAEKAPNATPTAPKATGLPEDKAKSSVAPAAASALPKTNIAVDKNKSPEQLTLQKQMDSVGEGDGEMKDNIKAPAVQASGTAGTGSVVQAAGPLRDGQGAMQYMQLQNGVKLDAANPAVLKNFKAMVQEYGETTGKKVIVTSGARTTQEQEALYRKNPQKAARPGRSLHEFGLALDVNSPDLDAMDQAGLMRKYGFTRPVGGEPWHMEPAGIQVNIAKAKEDPSFAEQAVQASLFKGGAGIGSIRGMPKEMLGRRDPAMALKLIESDAKEAKAPAQTDKDKAVAMATNLKPEVSAAKADSTEPKATGSGAATAAKTAPPIAEATKATAPGTVVASGSNPPAQSKPEASKPQAGSVGQQTAQSEKYSKVEGLPDMEEKPQITKSAAANDQPKDPKDRKEVRKVVESIAKKQNVDPEMMSAFAAVESSLNPTAKAPNTSAAGLFQFTKATWDEQMMKNARKHNLDPSTGPTDVNAATLMASEYIKSNKKSIQSVKSDPTMTDVYLTHFLGAGGARKLLSADPQEIAAKILPAAAKHNASYFYDKGTPLTVGEVYSRIDKKITKTAGDFGIDIKPSGELGGKKQAPSSAPGASSSSAPPAAASSSAPPSSPSAASQSGAAPSTSATEGTGAKPSPAAPVISTTAAAPAAGAIKPGLTAGATASPSAETGTPSAQLDTLPQFSRNIFKPQQPTVISSNELSSGMRGMATGTGDFGEITSTLTKQLSVQEQMLEVLKTIADKVGPEQFKDIKEAIGNMSPQTAGAAAVQPRSASATMGTVKSAIDLRRKVA